MAEVVNAVSKFKQSEETLLEMTKFALKCGEISGFATKELAGGFCNAVYLVEANGKKYVCKIAAKEDVAVMSHERDVVKAEALMLKEINSKINIQAPVLICFDGSKNICKSDYFFMSFIEGEPLNTIDPLEEANLGEIKRKIGEITGAMCSIKADYFGYPMLPETHFDNNYDFIYKIIEMLCQDIENIGGQLPNISSKEFMKIIESQKEVLLEAKIPCFAHTDTWEGNIMVKNSQFTGLIDYAAVIFGDPLISHDFHDFSEAPRKEFLEGFGKTEFTKNELIRISIYRLWQRLGMIAERYYRKYEDKNQYAWVIDTFTNELKNLKVLINE